MFFYKFDGDMFEKKNRENYQVICVVYSIKSLHCTSRLRSSVAVLGQLSRSTVNLQEKLQHVILWFHCAVPASISVFKACCCSGSMAPKNQRKQLSATPNVPCLYMCGCACLCYKFFLCKDSTSEGGGNQCLRQARPGELFELACGPSSESGEPFVAWFAF